MEFIVPGSFGRSPHMRLGLRRTVPAISRAQKGGKQVSFSIPRDLLREIGVEHGDKVAVGYDAETGRVGFTKNPDGYSALAPMPKCHTLNVRLTYSHLRQLGMPEFDGKQVDTPVVGKNARILTVQLPFAEPTQPTSPVTILRRGR